MSSCPRGQGQVLTSPFRAGRPPKVVEEVQDEDHLVAPGFGRLEVRDHREALAVGVDVVDPAQEPLFGPSPCLLGLELLPLDPIGDHHDPIVVRGVEKLSATPGPPRIPSAGGGHLPLSPRSGESGHVDFESARLVRHVREPASIGRELGSVLNPRRVQKHRGLPRFPPRRFISFHREDEDVRRRRSQSHFAEGQILPARVPGSRPLAKLTGCETLGLPGAIGSLPVEVRYAFLRSIRGEGDPVPIRGPELKEWIHTLERQPRNRVARRLVNPQVRLVPIANAQRKMTAIG